MEILSVKDLNISIDGITKIANGCFTVNQGDVVLLTGSNGCGKSTIIKVLVGGTFDYSDLSVGNSSALFLPSAATSQKFFHLVFLHAFSGGIADSAAPAIIYFFVAQADFFHFVACL